MKKLFGIFAIALVLGLIFASPARAQDDPVVGTVVSDPATVPAAGEYTLTANGSGYLPDTQILLGACIAPVDTLVAGVSTEEDVTAAAGSIDPLADCDLASAATVDVDSDGNFSQDWTGSVGDNFFFSAGALDQSQVGAVWVPIVAAQEGGDDGAEEELADTGLSSDVVAVLAAALVAGGLIALASARRYRLG